MYEFYFKIWLNVSQSDVSLNMTNTAVLLRSYVTE